MAQVQLAQLSKSYDGHTFVVEDINLTIPDKAFVVLVGPSGCGKSTILRMIAGLEPLTQGLVTIGNRVVNDVAPKDRDIAMVFQSYALYPHMTVYDNMAFGLKMRKTPSSLIQQRVAEAAEILELTTVLKRKPKELSGGQRQRVALGRAIVRNPQVFLMDEPLSNLDAKLRGHMRTEILKLHRRLGATTIYVTHDQVEAMTMGDVIVILHQGIIQQAGPPMTVYHQPANVFVGGFIGQMAFLTLPYQDGTVQPPQGSVWPLPEAVHSALKQAGTTPSQLTLGIRPEHFSGSPPVGATQSVTVQPDIVEALGHHQLVHFTLFNTPMIASLPPDVHVVEGQPLTLHVDLAQISYFHPETQRNVLFQTDAPVLATAS